MHEHAGGDKAGTNRVVRPCATTAGRVISPSQDLRESALCVLGPATSMRHVGTTDSNIGTLPPLLVVRQEAWPVDHSHL